MANDIDIVIIDRIDSAVARKIKAIGDAADMAHKRVLALQRLLSRGLGRNFLQSGGVNKFTSSVNRANTSVNRFSAAIAKVKLGLFNSQMLIGARNAAKLERSLYRTSQAFRSLLSGALLVGATAGIIDRIDAFAKTQNQLRQVAKVKDADGNFDEQASQRRLNTLTRRTAEIAEETRTPLSDLITTYRRFDDALKIVGKGQEDSLRLTETVAKAFKLQGTNATESSQSLRQLSQAFNKGKLDGDEFRASAETIPMVLNAIQDVAGITRAELFKFARDGKLSVSTLIKAFESIGAEVDEDFARLPRTVGDSLTQLSNRIIIEFGRLDQRFGITDRIIGFVDYLKNNLPQVSKLIYSLGAGFATLLSVQLLSKIPTLLGFFTSLPTLLAGAVAYFAYFGDRIKVSSDRMVTLNQAVMAFVESLSSAEGKNLFGNFFTVEGAQANLAGLLAFMQQLHRTILEIKAGLGFGFDLSKAFVLNESDFRSNISSLVVKSFVNAFIEVAAQFIEILEPALEYIAKTFGVLIIEVLRQRNSVVGNIPGMKFLSDIVDSQLKAQRDDLIKSDLLDFSKAAEMIRKGKTDTSDEFDAINGVILNSALERENILQNDLDVFQEWVDRQKELQDKHYQNALETEQRLNELQQEGSLRGPGEDTSGNQSGAAISAGDRTAILRSPFTDSALAQYSDFDLATIQAVRQETTALKQELSTLPQATQQGAQATQNAVQSVQTASEASTNAVQRVRQASQSTGQSISTSISAGAQQASAAVGSFADSAINSLNQVTLAAERAAASIRNIPSAGGFGGFGGFSSGGYTGNIGRRQIAGFVHGQEYVMPADVTKKYRPLLEAMHHGTFNEGSGSSGGGNSGGVNVYVENNSNAAIDVQPMGPNEVKIIARQVLQKESDKLLASTVRNPNSKLSKSLNQNLKTKRAR